MEEFTAFCIFALNIIWILEEIIANLFMFFLEFWLECPLNPNVPNDKMHAFQRISKYRHVGCFVGSLPNVYLFSEILKTVQLSVCCFATSSDVSFIVFFFLNLIILIINKYVTKKKEYFYLNNVEKFTQYYLSSP